MTIRGREDLIGRVAEESGVGAGEVTIDTPTEKEADRSPPEPLPVDADEFWGQENADREEVAHGAAHIPTVSATLPKQLGNFPFWRGKESFILALEEIYRCASPVGLDVFLGERQHPAR